MSMALWMPWPIGMGMARETAWPSTASFRKPRKICASNSRSSQPIQWRRRNSFRMYPLMNSEPGTTCSGGQSKMMPVGGASCPDFSASSVGTGSEAVEPQEERLPAEEHDEVLECLLDVRFGVGGRTFEGASCCSRGTTGADIHSHTASLDMLSHLTTLDLTVRCRAEAAAMQPVKHARGPRCAPQAAMPRQDAQETAPQVSGSRCFSLPGAGSAILLRGIGPCTMATSGRERWMASMRDAPELGAGGLIMSGKRTRMTRMIRLDDLVIGSHSSLDQLKRSMVQPMISGVWFSRAASIMPRTSLALAIFRD
mmetsp:Transcript_138603/g.431106  ORF Transcript_138603/g.431106 Transcript_138603/m.431106 type:complete len:311 (+) Transcript_138603:272-1204(+)